MRPRVPSLIVLALAALIARGASGQEYEVEVLREPPPPSLAGKVLETLDQNGFRVIDGAGKPFAEIWFRKSIPATPAPREIKGRVQFAFLAEGEFLGVLKFRADGHDFRDQLIPRGVYTIRYAVQPATGEHKGVSAYRDFALLIPAANDTDLSPLPKKALHEKSAESAGASHPACLMLLVPAEPPPPPPSMVHNPEKATWGVNLQLKLDDQESKESFTRIIQLIVVGVLKD